MRVSSTADLIGDSQRRGELLQFCGEQKIGLVWLQLLYDVDGKLENGEKLTCRIRQSEDFRQLLKEAHSASIKIHAFDGYAEFALAEYHPIPLAIVQSLIEFNESGDNQERFDGVHVGLEIPEKQVFSAPEFQSVLRKIIGTFGIGNRAELELKPMLEKALEQLQKSPEFTGAKQVDLEINGMEKDQPGLFAKWIMRSEITFGDDNSDEFEKETTASEKAFSSYPAFGGMTIHSFESAGKLLKKTAAVQE